MLRTWGVLLIFLLSTAASHALCSGQGSEQRVIFEDRFTDASGGWDKSPAIRIGGGEMAITLGTQTSTYLVLNRTTPLRAGDFCIQFTLPDPEPQNGSSASLVFWAKDGNNLHSVDFWSNGNLSFGENAGGRWTVIYSIDDPGRARTGPEQVFEVRVLVDVGRVRTWMNGTLMRSVDMPPPNANLDFGVFVEMDKQPATEKVFRIRYFNILQGRIELPAMPGTGQADAPLR